MRAVLVDVPESMLAERHRLGHDKFDEMWEGELHMVPPAGFEHNRLYNLLLRALLPAVDAAGLTILGDGSGLYDPDVPGHTSYRVPDLVVFEPVVASERGIEGRAHLVVEVRSTGDESYDKLTFYSRVGVLEVLVVERDTKEVRRWAVPAGSEDGGGVDLRLVEQQPDGDGWHRLGALPVRLRGGEGVLVVDDGASATTI